MISVNVAVLSIVMAGACLSLFILPGKTIVPKASLVVFVLQVSLFFGSFIAARRGNFHLGSIPSTSKTNRFLFLSSMLLLSALAFLSPLWSGLAIMAFQRAVVLFVPLILTGWLLLRVKNPFKTFELIAKAIVLFGVVLVVIGWVIFLIGDNHATLELGAIRIGQAIHRTGHVLRISSLTLHPNTLAIWLFFSILFTIYLASAQSITRYWAAGLVMLQLTGLAMTYSRTGIASTSLAVSLFFILSAADRKTVLKRFGWLCIVALVLVLFLFLLGNTEQFGSSNRLSLELLGRDRQWSVAWQSFLENWLLGVGFGVSFETVFKPTGIAFNAHNIYLTVLGELGVLGFSFFALAWGTVFSEAWRLMRTPQRQSRLYGALLLSIFVSLLVHQVFESTILVHRAITVLWFVLATITFQVSQFCQDSNPSEGNSSPCA